jgi:hypothetical protein
MIILEGPDGAGKTTLLLNLLDHFPDIEQHAKASTSTGGPVAKIDLWAINDLISWPVQPLSFYDRHPMFSEPLYGHVLRGGKFPGWFLGADALRHGIKMMNNGLIVFCLPPLEVVVENIEAEEQLSGVKDHILELWSSYEVLIAHYASKFPKSVVHYDYTRNGDLDDVLTLVEAHQVRWNRKNKGYRA